MEQILAKKDSNPYFLVPGTGGNYDDDWKPTYEILLGKLPASNTTLPGSAGIFPGGLGYDVCGVSP